jgi:CrcB protein
MRRSLPGWLAAMLWVAVGAIPGALLRWWLANLLLANTLGCFVVGASGLLETPSTRRRLLVGMGFAGSLTSFSSWVFALLSELQRGQWGDLLGQIVRDGVLGVGALLLGALAHRRLSRLRAGRLRR